jgi:type IV pilus assembly protein PilC
MTDKLQTGHETGLADKTGSEIKVRKNFFSGGVRQKDFTVFTRQFATLMDAGLPIVRSLNILHHQMKSGLLKDAVGFVKEDVEGGASLSEAMSSQPRVFNDLYVNMIKAGEAGGVLDTILTRLAEFREKSQALRRRIVGALIYPAAVTTIASAILVIIMMFIVPRFSDMFRDMNVKLPAMTAMLMSFANFMKRFWFVILGVPVLLVIAYRMIYMNPKGAYFMDSVKMWLPIVGQIVSKSSISVFCRTLGTLVESGVPILDALEIIKNATGNRVLTAAVQKVHDSIKEGDTIAEPMRDSGVFDEIVVNMVDVGEETGEIDKMLIKIADNYDNDVDTLVEGMMSLLEPVLIVFMGLSVGFIVVSLFMPIVGMINKFGG